MRAFSISELMELTTIELCDLVRKVSESLERLPDGSEARAKALYNLGLLRRELTRRNPSL